MDRNELAELKAELRRMQSRVEELESAAPEPVVNRRHMLRGLGAAAVGAAAGGLAFAHPAAATDGGNIIIGNIVQTAESPTMLTAAPGSWNDQGAFTVTNDATLGGSLAGLAASKSMITAYADSAQDSKHHIGMLAISTTGVGAKLDGPVPLKLSDASGAGAPNQAGLDDLVGSFRVNAGDLWFCVANSGGHQWRRITGPGEAGSYHALTPGRVYDSRFVSGRISSGANATLSVANTIDPLTGAPAITDFVPALATAVVANVTVVGTASGGYLAVNPGGVTAVTASTINWSAAGQILANGITLTLNASRQVTVVCGGGGAATDYIIDVLGYYL